MLQHYCSTLAEGDVFYPQQYDFNNCPEELLCSEETILDQLKSLDATKSTGIDEISATMLKNTAHNIAPSITNLFNLSIKQGRFPDTWKIAHIVPVPNKGDMSKPSN